MENMGAKVCHSESAAILKGLFPSAPGWPDSERAYLGSAVAGIATLKGLHPNDSGARFNPFKVAVLVDVTPGMPAIPFGIGKPNHQQPKLTQPFHRKQRTKGSFGF